MFAGVDHVDDTTLEVSQGGHRLHLDGVHFLQLMVEDPRRIDDLVPDVVVLHVTDVQGLGGEGVRLHFDVGLAEAVHER